MEQIPTLRTAMQSARRTFRDKRASKTIAVGYRKNGEVWAVTVKPRGGWKKVCNLKPKKMVGI